MAPIFGTKNYRFIFKLFKHSYFSGVYISTNLWNAKYQVEFANQKKVDAMELLEKLNKHGLEPNAKTFEVCTSIFAAEGKFAEITYTSTNFLNNTRIFSTIIDYMKDLKMTVTLKILENFVYASALVGGIEAGTKALAVSFCCFFYMI